MLWLVFVLCASVEYYDTSVVSREGLCVVTLLIVGLTGGDCTCCFDVSFKGLH